MFEKMLEIKDMVVDKIKNTSLVRKIEFGSGIAMLVGIAVLKLMADDEIMAADILEKQDDGGAIEIEDYEVSSVDDNSEEENAE